MSSFSPSACIPVSLQLCEPHCCHFSGGCFPLLVSLRTALVSMQLVSELMVFFGQDHLKRAHFCKLAQSDLQKTFLNHLKRLLLQCSFPCFSFFFFCKMSNSVFIETTENNYDIQDHSTK